MKYLLNTKIQENSGVIFNLSNCNGTPIAIDTSKPKTSGEAGWGYAISIRVNEDFALNQCSP